jgi:hypothetical protein
MQHQKTGSRNRAKMDRPHGVIWPEQGALTAALRALQRFWCLTRRCFFADVMI